VIYRVCRALLRLGLYGFFRRVHVQGRSRIPDTGPVLFVSNHINAFVDPLLILTNVRRKVTLTAKSTLVKNPLLRVVIWALDTILLHRRGDREEGSDPRENLFALSEAVRRLREGGALFIFPEGVSHSDPGMRRFRTGAARMVADYLDDPTAPELSIVPVGLHFTRKDGWRSEAVALVGEPVGARAWVRGHADGGAGTEDAGVRAVETPLPPVESAAAAGGGGARVDVRALTHEMQGWVEALTINFASAEERDLILRADRLFAYRPGGPPPVDRPEGLDAEARVDRVHKLQGGAHLLRTRDPRRFRSLADRAEALTTEMDRLGVAAFEVGLPMNAARVALFVVREVEVLLVGAPLALWGWLAHLVPLTVTRRLVAALSTDEDHPASNAVFMSVPIFFVWWIVVAALAFLMAGGGWGALLVLSLPLSGAIHLRYRDRAGSVVRRVRTFLFWWRHPDVRERLSADLDAWHEQIRALEPLVTSSPHGA